MRFYKYGAGIIFLLLAFTAFSTAEKLQTSRNNIPEPKSAPEVTFVELGSLGCVPCNMMQAVMTDIEKEYGSHVKVIFHNVRTKAGASYIDQYKIVAIPAQVFLDQDGKEFFRHIGFFPKEEIAKVLEKQGIKRAGPKENAPAEKTVRETKAQSGQICK